MDESPIVRVLRHYGWADSYRDSLRWQPIKCIFHDDRNASASLSLDYDAFKCQACGLGGNPVTLIARKEGIPFDRAERQLAEILGREYNPVPAPTNKRRKRLSDGEGTRGKDDRALPVRGRRRPRPGA